MKLYINFIIIMLLAGCTSHPQKLLYKQKPASYSYIIAGIKTNHIYKEYAADIYATPASCQKVITALTALKTLGPDYRFETKLYVSKRHKSIQDMLISFSGDPTFTSAHLHDLLAPFKGTQVKGKIILDASVFGVPAYSPNIIIGDIGTGYSPPVFSINIDKNFITLEITPTTKGELADIKSDSIYKINSTLTTTSDVSAIHREWDGDQIKVTGNINLSDQTQKLKISPEKIEPYIISKVIKILKELKIKGKIEIIYDKNKLPSNPVLMNAHKSKMLKEIISPALKESDNLIFDSLYLTILRVSNAEDIKDWSEGNKIIKDLIAQHFAIDMGNALIVDGSGLSRYNRIQPRKLLEILRHGYLIPEFVAALPKAGEEKSTLEKRNNLPSNIRAKTGSMLGINCLCGYSIDSKHPKVFVFMANNFAPPVTELVEVMDKFISNNLGN